MFRNETTVPSAMFRNLPRSAEIRPRGGGEDQIPGSRRLEELQQLTRCVRHVCLATARQELPVFQLYISTQAERIAIERLVANQA
jgi:hypothetical protein